MEWPLVQTQIDNCRRCEQEAVRYLVVPSGQKRHPPYPPPVPTRLLFVSVAPPWGGDYFWDESKHDKVREGLFSALATATGQQFNSVRAFREAGYFLIPGVKCPSQKCGKDHEPSAMAIKNCASHLVGEIGLSHAERILALGREPMKSVSHALELEFPGMVHEYRRKLLWGRIAGHLVPVAGTYFPGNNRHKGFAKIAEDIKWILAQEPKS